MSVPVTFASFEAGSYTDRGTGGAGQNAIRAGEDLHQKVMVGDAPLGKRHPGMVQEVLDVHPAWRGGEVVDDDDVVVSC